MLRTMLLSACLMAPALGAEAAQVTSGTFAAWRFEVVSNTAPGGTRRVACSVATGPETTPTLFLSFSRSGDDETGTLSGFAFAEIGPPMGEMPIGAAAEIEFTAGDVRARGKVSVAAAPDGENAQSEAYPASEDVPKLVVAMQGNPAVALMRGTETLRAIPLDGFADAYAVAARACAYNAVITD